MSETITMTEAAVALLSGLLAGAVIGAATLISEWRAHRKKMRARYGA